MLQNHFPNLISAYIVYHSVFAEDLDKTLEEPIGRMSPKGDSNPEPHKREVESSFTSVEVINPHSTAAWLFSVTFNSTV